MRKYYILEWLEDAARSQTPFFVLVQQGLIPIAQRSQFEFQYNALTRAIENEKQGKTGRKTSHEKPSLTPVDDGEPIPFDAPLMPNDSGELYKLMKNCSIPQKMLDPYDHY